jgi:hypothetical protein
MPAKKADPAPEPSLELPLESSTEIPAEFQTLSAATAALSLSSEPAAPAPYSQQRALDRIAEAIEGQSIALSMMADVLQRMASVQKDEVALGFSEPQGYAVTVDVGATEDLGGALWCIYHGGEEPKTPLPHQLTCRIVGASIVTIPTKKRGDSVKLILRVMADREYDLLSGLDTNWSGSVLQALKNATDEQLTQVLRIFPRQGTKDPNAVFATVYVGAAGNEKIDSIGKPPESERQAIIDRVNTILGYVPRGQQSNEAGDEAMDEAVDRFIDWKTEGSPLWDEAKKLGWTQEVVMQFLADQGCTFEGKGSFKGVTKSKLDVIRDMLLDREVLNEYAGVNPLAGAGGGF